MRIVASGDYKRVQDPTCAPFEPVPCDVFITEATFGLPVFRHPDAMPTRSPGCCESVAQFPERAHLVGAYALGKAQRVIALLRDAGYDAPIYHPRRDGQAQRATIRARASTLGDLRPVNAAAKKADFAGAIVVGAALGLRRSLGAALSRSGAGFASGWMRVRQRARQRGVELPLIISDHADWDELTAHHRRDRRRRNLGDAWPRGGAGALVRATQRSLTRRAAAASGRL